MLLCNQKKCIGFPCRYDGADPCLAAFSKEPFEARPGKVLF